MSEPLRYAMLIQWSDNDEAYVVSFPEWEATGLYFVHTHGDTYEDAVQKGHELLDELVEVARAQGRSLPEPRRYAAAGA